MTPRDTVLLVQGWNAAQAGDSSPAPMSVDQLEDLIARYPDEH